MMDISSPAVPQVNWAGPNLIYHDACSLHPIKQELDTISFWILDFR